MLWGEGVCLLSCHHPNRPDCTTWRGRIKIPAMSPQTLWQASQASHPSAAPICRSTASSPPHHAVTDAGVAARVLYTCQPSSEHESRSCRQDPIAHLENTFAALCRGGLKDDVAPLGHEVHCPSWVLGSLASSHLPGNDLLAPDQVGTVLQCQESQRQRARAHHRREAHHPTKARALLHQSGEQLVVAFLEGAPPRGCI